MYGLFKAKWFLFFCSIVANEYKKRGLTNTTLLVAELSLPDFNSTDQRTKEAFLQPLNLPVLTWHLI